MTDEPLKIRPYARLLTMLGEQLIKNERIALIELIKNSYDADARWVKINFVNFKNNYSIKKDSKIIIEDSGHGMSEDIIKNHWLNPATPEKMNRKKIKNTTDSGRIIQGEKGIGRFAILKLGRKIKLYSRAKGESTEQVVVYDFEKYDDDFLTENNEKKEIFLDELSVNFESQKPQFISSESMLLGRKNIKRKPFGTKIEITNLKGNWSEKKVQDVARDILSLQSIFTTNDDEKSKGFDSFRVYIHKDDEYKDYVKQKLNELHLLIEESSVLKVENGYFDSENKEFNFNIKTHSSDKFVSKTIKLSDSNMTGMKVYKDYFTYPDPDDEKVKHNYLDERGLECGSFRFSFYAFDFDSSEKVPVKFKLSKDDKRILKDHRVYLYRDEIRVYPYGESDDDWLRVDALRGTFSAAAFLSNDQMIGKIDITQEGNPKLKDKTNREGLIEDGNALGDFIVLIQLILNYIRKKPYKRYRIDINEKFNIKELKKKKVEFKFTELRKAAGSDKKILGLIDKVQDEYLKEKDYFQTRTKLTEDLAGVGLSVETASHDLMGMMDKVLINLDGIIRDLMMGDEVSCETILKELQSIRGGVSFIEAQIKDIQLLFRSNRKRRKNIRVTEIIKKVERIYRRVLSKYSIKFEIITDNQPLVAKTTDAILLQLLLNLFDNSVYWLQECHDIERVIKITLKGSEGVMIFSDNGPGIESEDEEYIFEPFYSGKAEDGKGLGLYIARQLLERNDYSIDLMVRNSQKLLSGANFKIDFKEGES